MTPIIVSSEWPLTAEDYLVGGRVPRTLRIWWFPLLTLAGLAAGLWVSLGNGSIFWAIPPFVTLAWQNSFWSAIRPATRRQIAEQAALSRTARARVSLWIDDTGVAIVRDLGVNAFKWDAIRDIRHDRGVLHFTIENGDYRYLLPDRWFDDPAAVRAAFREKCPQQGSNL